MAVARQGRLGAVAALGALIGTAMCVSDFDTTRQPPAVPMGTVGEEIFRVVCERVDVGENPGDIDGQAALPVCAGQTDTPDAATLNMGMLGPKVRALAARRTAIAAALDHGIPMALYDDMDALLVNLLPLYGPDNGVVRDGGTIRLVDGGSSTYEDLLPQTTRALSTLLTAWSSDNDLTSAFSRISQHQGFRPPAVAIGLTRNLLGYSDVDTVLGHTFDLIRSPGQYAPAGSAFSHWAVLLDTLRGEFAHAAPSSRSDQQNGTTLDATLDLFLRTDPALGTGREHLLVRRDPFGMPRVASNPDGSYPAPFTDTDPHDGYADSLNGRFVDANRRAITVPTPFPANEAPVASRDSSGRAIVQSQPLYQYVDLDHSVLAALLHDGRQLLDPANNVGLTFAYGASMLLGSRVPVTKDYMLRHACSTSRVFTQDCDVPAMQYTAFDAPSSLAPLVDTVHAVGTALTSPDIDRILTLMQSLFSDHESALARNMGAMLAINDSSNRHPEATMAPTSNIWDDMIDVARRIAQTPGLLEDILNATKDPHTVALGHAFAEMTRNRDRVEPVWSQARQNDRLTTQTLGMPVDRSRPDTQNLNGGPDDNRSVLQRFLHLIYDLNGVEICNKEGAQLTFDGIPIVGTATYPQTFSRCNLIRIPDAAVFYLQSIIGNAHITLMATGLLGFLNGIPALHGSLDSIIESQSGITGFNTTPTPYAINRLAFQPDSLRRPFTNGMLSALATRDGRDIRTVHPRTIFALEMYQLYESITPLVQAFDRHPGGDKLFVDLLSALHLHYASRQAGQYQGTSPSMPFYSTMDGAVKYEPILVDAFAGDLLASLSQLSSTLPQIDVGSGRTGIDAAAQLGRMLLDPNALTGLAYRDGRISTMRCDNTTPVTQPNLYYLFADSMNEIDTAFAGSPSQLQAWQTARSHLVDIFLAVDGAGTQAAQFRNRNIPRVSRLALDWARARLDAHRAIGDSDAWARTLSRRFADTLHGPSFSATLDFLLDVYNDAPTRNAMGGLLMNAFDDSRDDPNNPFGNTVTAVADLFQNLRDDTDIDPLLHGLAPAFQRALPASDGSTLREEIVPVTVRFLDRARLYDTNHTVDRVLANLVQRAPVPLLADEPLVVLGDAIAETHRGMPGQGGPLSGDDFSAVFSQVSEFFSDQTRGMEQFYYIVQHRRF